MVDINGRPDQEDDVEVIRYNVGFLHLLPGKYGPATVFYHPASATVILVVHAYESDGGGKLLATKNPDKIGMTTYHFYRSEGFESGHPVFENDMLQLVNWGDFDIKETGNKTKIPHDLFSIACESLSLREKLARFLKVNGHISHCK